MNSPEVMEAYNLGKEHATEKCYRNPYEMPELREAYNAGYERRLQTMLKQWVLGEKFH